MSKYQYDIFLSCAGENEKFARRLQARIQEEDCEGRSLKAFHYKRDILPAKEWDIEVKEALKASRTLGCVLSPTALQTDWVRKEYNIFRRIGGDREIIPLLRQDCDYSSLTGKRWCLDFRDDAQFEDQADKLLVWLCPNLHEETLLAYELLETLQDFAQKHKLGDFVRGLPKQDMIEWDRVCAGKMPYEQAQVIFDMYNDSGKRDLKNLRRQIRIFQKRMQGP